MNTPKLIAILPIAFLAVAAITPAQEADTQSQKATASSTECTTSNPAYRKLENIMKETSYSWKVDVTNPFDTPKKVMVSFVLKDKDGFEIASSVPKITTIPAKKTITVSDKWLVSTDIYNQATSCEAEVEDA